LVIYNPSTVERREQRGRESAGSATGGIERGWREREFRVRASNFGRNRLLEGPDIYIRICRVAFPRVPNYFRYDAGNLTDRSKECELGRQQGPGNGLHPGHYKGREVPYRTGTAIPSPSLGTKFPVWGVKTRCHVPASLISDRNTNRAPFPPLPLAFFHRQARAEASRRYTHAAPAINRSRVLLTKSSGITRCPSCPSWPPRWHAKGENLRRSLFSHFSSE
jgi:hypothetical protein